MGAEPLEQLAPRSVDPLCVRRDLAGNPLPDRVEHLVRSEQREALAVEPRSERRQQRRQPLGVRLPLGVDRSATYVSAPVPLSPGDTLLLYTDGVVEAMNRSDKQYGTARLEAQFRTHGSKKTRELLTAIRADLEAHAEGRELGDDVTLLAVKTTG